MFGLKGVVAAVTVATMIGSSAFAADMSLAPGKPAGVDKAQIGTGTLLIGGGIVAVLTGIVIVTSDQSGTYSGAANTFAAGITSNTSP